MTRDGFEDVREAAAARRDHAMARLAELVAIPSVSADPEHAADVTRAARWLADELPRWGAGGVRILPTDGAPAVLARFPSATPGAATVIVYCHYDVQPAEPLDEWNTPPFELTAKDGHLYGRGAADDKGPILAHLAALDAWYAVRGGPPVEVVLLLDGEEESGSAHLHQALSAVAGEISTDLVVVSDTSILGEGKPSLCYGLRGTSAFEVTLRVADHDRHSGRFGGVAPNAALELARLLATLHAPDGSIAVPGFYDDVRAISDAERERLRTLEIAAPDLVPGDPAAAVGEPGYSRLERAWARPTIDVTGMSSGHTGPGPKTILPAVATAKLSARLVPEQTPATVARLVERHLRQQAPAHVTVEIGAVHGGAPLRSSVEAAPATAALAAYRAGYDAEPVLTREGGSVPVVAQLAETLGAEPLLLGCGLPDQAEHAPNERLSLPNVTRAIRTFATFWGLLGHGGSDQSNTGQKSTGQTDTGQTDTGQTTNTGQTRMKERT